jgi:hypothetical protein
MVVIPREKPVIENLNIYYLDVKRLLEHYQGEIGSGGIYFKSNLAQGVIFFDKDDLLNGFFQDKSVELSGPQAIDRLLNSGDEVNFSVSIYQLDPQEVHFWASVPAAEKIYKDLSTEFTDLQGLIKKMRSERLTGYIDVSILGGKESGLIFFLNGKVMGGSFSWENGGLSSDVENQKRLIRKTKETGGSFNVCRIALANMRSTDGQAPLGSEVSAQVLEMLAELLAILEKVVSSQKNMRIDFSRLLKKKFLENAERYDFLDPFAGEFEYVDHKILYEGRASAERIVAGVTVSVRELAKELGLLPALVDQLNLWRRTYEEEIRTYEITF